MFCSSNLIILNLYFFSIISLTISFIVIKSYLADLLVYNSILFSIYFNKSIISVSSYINNSFFPLGVKTFMYGIVLSGLDAY